MKEYPSIPGSDYVARHLDQSCFAFYKYDGSNLRFEWHRKTGWVKFGTRTRLFDEKDQEFGCAIKLFMEQFAVPLEKVFVAQKDLREAIAFCEFFGPHSFAGQHSLESLNELGFKIDSNDPKQLVLLDVNLHKKGIVSPKDFVSVYAPLVPSAKLVYQGKLTSEFVTDVREGKYTDREGVVCKGGERHSLWMMKIKTNAYKKELVDRFGSFSNHWE